MNSFAVWFVVVPITLRAMDASLAWLHKDIIKMLPFSLYYLFFSASAFFLGSICFQLSCPSIISGYKSYRDFSRSGAAAAELKWHFRNIAQTHRAKKEWMEMFQYEIAQKTARNGASLNAIADVDKMIRLAVIDQAAEADLYALVVRAHDHTRPILRASISMLYAIGCVFLGIVVSQNFATVVENFISAKE